MSKSGIKSNSAIISSQLLDLAENNEGIVTNTVFADEIEDKVAVRITAKNVNNLLPKLEKYNFETISSSPENHFVEGFIPVDKIPKLTTLNRKGLMGVLPIIEPTINRGNIISQADFIHESDRVRNIPNGYDGTGVTIGIMSDSFDDLGGAAGDILTENLPANGVTVLQDYDNHGSDEGRGMAQLIHDLAPGSDLAFSSVFFGEADFAQQIRDLADPTKGNAQVLVDDVSYFYEPYFQDGVIAQAVDDVVDNYGVTYFSSAGNSASKSFESDKINFVSDNTLDSLVTFPGTYYDFDTGVEVDLTQDIGLSDGQTIQFVFQWDDPFYTTNGVDTDLDLYLLDSSGDIVADSTTDNIGSQTPVEYLAFTDTTTNASTDIYELVIANFGNSPDPKIIKYLNRGNIPESVEYPHDDSTVVGHSAAINAQAVAAVPWFNQETPESFTSQGSTTIAFEADGTPLEATEVRQTPDIAAIDGTNTTFFGNDIGLDVDSFPNFFGTSAAAPHAAAIAALIKQAEPDLTPAEIYSRLQITAKDVGDSGFDDLTGHGLINAYDAIYGSTVSASLNFSDDFESGVLGSAYETNTTGAGRIQVTADNDPIDGYHLTLDGASEGISSLNEVILHFDTTNFANVELSFDQKEFGDEDNTMSESFVNSENSDGVALSVDGTVWYSLVSLTGSNSTETYQTNSFDLTNFAEEKDLILDGEVQLKFQQFDTHSINADGMAFDNIILTAYPTVSTTPTYGDDSLLGSIDDDTIKGLAGNDNIDGLDGNDLLVGNNGNDSLLGGSGLDTLRGNNGIDSLDGGDDDDSLFGGNDKDYLDGGTGDDSLIGWNGNDSLLGGSGLDTLRGNNGVDSLDGGDDEDYLDGGTGDDSLIGWNGNDSLLGGSGLDTLRGNNGIDSLDGGDGDDSLFGDHGNDNIDGLDGNDRLLGGVENDYLLGGSGVDTLRGDDGDDTLVGGANIDHLYGLSGRDTFFLDNTLTTEDLDIIYDFDLSLDMLGVRNLSVVKDFSIANNSDDTGSLITGENGQQVAILVGLSDIAIEDLTFVLA